MTELEYNRFMKTLDRIAEALESIASTLEK
jgi:hypothetical protein